MKYEKEYLMKLVREAAFADDDDLMLFGDAVAYEDFVADGHEYEEDVAVFFDEVIEDLVAKYGN